MSRTNDANAFLHRWDVKHVSPWYNSSPLPRQTGEVFRDSVSSLWHLHLSRKNLGRARKSCLRLKSVTLQPVHKRFSERICVIQLPTPVRHVHFVGVDNKRLKLSDGLMTVPPPVGDGTDQPFKSHVRRDQKTFTVLAKFKVRPLRRYRDAIA